MPDDDAIDKAAITAAERLIRRYIRRTPVVEAGVRALRDGKTAYTATLGLPALREAIA